MVLLIYIYLNKLMFLFYLIYLVVIVSLFVNVLVGLYDFFVKKVYFYRNK